MPKVARRKRCGECGMLPRKGSGVKFAAVEPSGGMKWVYDKNSKGEIIGRHEEPEDIQVRDSLTTPKPPSRPPKSSPFHPDYRAIPYGTKGKSLKRKRGGGWEEELKKAMERDRIAEGDKKVAAELMKVAAADAKKRTKGKSIKRAKKG